MLTDSQVEQKIYSIESTLRTIQSNQLQQSTLLNGLQTAVNLLNQPATSASPTGTVVTGAQTFGGVSNFQAEADFAAIAKFNAEVDFGPAGLVYFKGSTLTVTRPLKINGSNLLITATINLASANDVTGTLPAGSGGTGVTTIAALFALLTYAQISTAIGSSGYSGTVAGAASKSVVNGIIQP